MISRVGCGIGIVPVFFAVQVFAQTSEIVDSAYVANAINNGSILWDVRDAAAYKKGHIAGAVNIGSITEVLRDPIKEDWLPTATIESLLGHAGIDLPNKEVIVYGRAGDPTAYFGLLTVRYFGGKSGKVYQGGIDEWKATGMTVATEPTKLLPVPLKLEPREHIIIWTDEMVGKVAEAKGGKVQIIDVRTPQEYSGAAISAIRGGHIPSAFNIPVSENLANPPTPEMMAKRECNLPNGFAQVNGGSQDALREPRPKQRNDHPLPERSACGIDRDRAT